MIDPISQIKDIAFPGNFKPNQSIPVKRIDSIEKIEFKIISDKYVLENKMIVFERYDHNGQLILRVPWKAQRVNAIA